MTVVMNVMAIAHVELNLSVKDKLLQWAVTYNISQDALSALLVVL